MKQVFSSTTFKRILKSIGVIFIVVAILPLLFARCALSFYESPPEPEITRGEFPFVLTYEIDGEVVVVADVYVCEYLGFAFNMGMGIHRAWEGYLKSNGSDGVYITEDSERKIYCYVGEPEYYMGDETYLPDGEITPHLYIVKKDPQKIDMMGHEEIMEQYSIRLLVNSRLTAVSTA